MLWDGPDNDWGCVGPDELFVSSGPTPSLLSLAARVECRERLRRVCKLGIETGQIPERAADEERQDEEEQKFNAQVEQGALVQYSAMNESKNTTGCIKTTQRGVKNLKQIAFEVEKFVAANLTDRNERQTAEQRMVVALGARPPRRKAVNYRTLKEQRTEAKRKETEEVEQQQQQKNIWRAVRDGKVRKRAVDGGRGRKNGNGVMKKRRGNEKRKTGKEKRKEKRS
uniref:Uncharacterized protein n=1 Tax=Globodera rostochiensis TaxID=31243 RepID=A0A914I9S4_GLORO